MISEVNKYNTTTVKMNNDNGKKMPKQPVIETEAERFQREREEERQILEAKGYERIIINNQAVYRPIKKTKKLDVFA